MGSRRQGSTRSDAEGERRWAPGEWWEWVAIFLAMAALWPKILRWDHLAWDVVLWAALVVMILVMRRRIRRVRESWKKQ